MPPVILWAIGAIGAAFVGRVLYRETQRVNAELHPQPAPSADEPGSVRPLERDPATGIYRPK